MIGTDIEEHDSSRFIVIKKGKAYAEEIYLVNNVNSYEFSITSSFVRYFYLNELLYLWTYFLNLAFQFRSIRTLHVTILFKLF